MVIFQNKILKTLMQTAFILEQQNYRDHSMLFHKSFLSRQLLLASPPKSILAYANPNIILQIHLM